MFGFHRHHEPVAYTPRETRLSVDDTSEIDMHDIDRYRPTVRDTTPRDRHRTQGYKTRKCPEVPEVSLVKTGENPLRPWTIVTKHGFRMVNLTADEVLSFAAQVEADDE